MPEFPEAGIGWKFDHAWLPADGQGTWLANIVREEIARLDGADDPPAATVSRSQNTETVVVAFLTPASRPVPVSGQFHPRREGVSRMHYQPTLRASVLAGCRRCEWSYAADDSEFPSEFVFELAYEVDEGALVLRAIEPREVVVCDDRGQRLYVHQLAPRERPSVWEWFHARLRRQAELMLDRMEREIARTRSELAAQSQSVFEELRAETAGLDVFAARGQSGKG